MLRPKTAQEELVGVAVVAAHAADGSVQRMMKTALVTEIVMML